MENKTEQTIKIEIPRSDTDDIINGMFKIHLNEEIVELSNDFCRYYYATDDAEQDEFYAIVFENSFIPRINVLDYLSKNSIEGLNNILAYSIVRLSTTQEERLVAIVNGYDVKSTLANQLKKGQTIKPQQFENIYSVRNKIRIYWLNNIKFFSH